MIARGSPKHCPLILQAGQQHNTHKTATIKRDRYEPYLKRSGYKFASLSHHNGALR